MTEGRRQYPQPHKHDWVIDHKYPPDAGIMAECDCGEVRLTLPTEIKLDPSEVPPPITLHPELDGPGNIYPPDWK